MTVDSFYSGQSILMTGASGFLGKVILEKLLRDCRGITNIYVLLRSKQGVDPRRRVEELTNSVVFSRLRRENESLFQKIIPVSGDVTMPGLGISPSDERKLEQQVSIVFHVAATIRFDEPLRRAVDINVTGTKRVLELCKKLHRFKSLVHVSTAYCNRTKIDIKESVYEDVVDPQKIIDIASWADDELLNSMSGHLFDGRPSSYHYTKALAENLLWRDPAGLPTAIVRPSIITAAWKEPLPGWIDNYNGPTGYFVVSGKGILRSMVVQKEKICDMIPVDVVANTCILSAVFVAMKANFTLPNGLSNGISNGTQSSPTPQSLRKVVVFNCTSGSLNPISWGRVKEVADPLLIKHPSMELFRYPGSRFHANKTIHNINILIEHTAVAFIVDLVFKVTGHKPILTQVYSKVHRTIAALEYFTTNEWTFVNSNFVGLSSFLPPTETEKFPCDVRRIHWPTYMETYILGVRKFLLKEDPSTLPKARVKLERLYYILLLAKITVVLGSIHQVWYHYPTIKYIWKNFTLPVLKRAGVDKFLPPMLR